MVRRFVGLTLAASLVWACGDAPPDEPAPPVSSPSQQAAGDLEVAPVTSPVVLTPSRSSRERFERDYIVRALAAQRGNISRAAESLRVERSNLYRKMRAFGIIAPRKGNQVDQRRTSLSDRRAPDPA